MGTPRSETSSPAGGLSTQAERSQRGDESLAPGARSLLGMARRLVDVGVAPGLEEQLALRLRIANGLAAVNLGVCVLVGVQHALAGRSGLVLGLAASAASWTAVFAANRFGSYRVSRLGVLVLFLANIVIYVGVLGSAARLELMCFAVSLLGCFLFTLDDWLCWILGGLLSMAVYFGAESWVRPLFGPPMAGASSPVLSEVTTFVELAFVAYVFALESRRSFRALRRETRSLEAARAQAQSAANAKAQFLATMSHELRTPLNGVIGMTQLLQQTRLDAEQREHLRTLAASGEYLMSLLDGVLDLNKLEAGRADLESSVFQPSSALESVSRLLFDRAKHKGLELSVSVDPAAAGWVSGDQRRLQQILFNLVGNGIKFTERGSVAIRVTRRSDAADATSAWYDFVVEDTGIGMSETEMEQLFTPFRQANTSIARRFGGTGLGLAISHGLATLMGGRLSCESRPGAGSRFLLSLRFEERAAPEPSELPARAPDPPSALGLRVLLAEDNIVNQKVVSAFLKGLGCECEVVADGQQALDRLSQRPFDVVLMDCQMPELDGVSAAERIRAGGSPYSAIPIVALTANVLDEERERCRAAGMNGYLTKPLARATLHAELRRYVRGDAPRVEPGFSPRPGRDLVS